MEGTYHSIMTSSSPHAALHLIIIQCMSTQMMPTSILRFSFLCGLRGYNEYQTVWNPVIDEVLCTHYERNNIHDRYAIAAINLLSDLYYCSITYWSFANRDLLTDLFHYKPWVYSLL